MGGLFSIGWTLDDCLDLTWEQLIFCASAVMKHKSDFYSMVMESIGGALGVGPTGKKGPRKSSNKGESLEQQLRGAGIQVQKG